jgi:uncharacterized Zn finger protein (UPF0148 family)
MFEKLIKELEDLQRNPVSIPVKSDGEGYVDRECPNEDCLFVFKVHQDDWRNIFSDEKVFCPMCRHEAKSNSWWTQEQLKHAHEQTVKYLNSRIDHALTEGARDFNNRQPKNSFLSLKMTYNGKSSSTHYMLPIPASEEMHLKIQCAKCKARYSVIGSAFFCPACGHNSAEETFDNSIQKIEAKIRNLPVIREAVAAISKDEAENTCRSLIESSLNECVVAFQRFCEVVFPEKSPTTKIKFNAFQKIDVGGDYWRDLLGESYADWLTPKELNQLNLLFQQRHLLAHTEGIVDQKYIDKSGGNTYIAGQRLVVKERDVLQLVKLASKIVSALRSKLT